MMKQSFVSCVLKPVLLAIVFIQCVHSFEGLGLEHSGCRSAYKRHLARRQLGSVSGEGASVNPSGGAKAAGYSCDPNACKLPHCRCADAKPPRNLALTDVPQFITITADDAIQSYTLDVLNALTNGRKNPNGCPVTTTYFNSLDYTNYSMVTDYYVAGNEVADHTITHVAQPSIAEVSGNLVALNALAGIPFKRIIGFRAPFLNYTKQNLLDLAKMSFTYDSSSTASLPASDPNTDAFWPYTLDNGMANDCEVEGLAICHGEPKLPGFWEIPMYTTFNPDKTVLGLMDPWLESTPDKSLAALKWTFNDHYTSQKQPFGLYTHPIHISTSYPGAPVPGNQKQIQMLNQFLDFAMTSGQFQNVWMVNNRQLLAWMQNPVPASQLNTLPEFQCQTPNIAQEQICSGIPAKEASVLEHCISDTAGDSLNNSPFYTCYGCPTVRPTPDQPNPPQKNNDGTVRKRIDSSCDTPFWDPIAGKCLNSGFQDGTRPIGPNGANLTSSGSTNTGNLCDSSDSSDGFKKFGNGATPMRTYSDATLGRFAVAIAVLSLTVAFFV